jgi:hypothetical protein
MFARCRKNKPINVSKASAMWEFDQAILPSLNAGQDRPEPTHQPLVRPVTRQAQVDSLSAAVGIWHAALFGLAAWLVLLVGGVTLWQLL